MRILVIHQYYLGQGEGGGSRFNQFAKYWSKRGHKVTVIAGTVHYATGKKEDRYRGKWVVEEEAKDNVSVYRTYVSPGYNKSFLGRLVAYLSFTVSSFWAGVFLAGKQDLILASSPPLSVGISGILIALFKRAPFVFEVRDLWPESAIETGVLKNRWLIKSSFWLEAWIYRRAEKINVLTPAFKQRLIEVKGVAAAKIIMIPNGADLDIFLPGDKDNWVRKEYHLNNKFVVMYMGAHGVANDLSVFVELARELQGYKDLLFMLVGDGMEKPMLVRKAREYGLRNVIFVDSQPKSRIVDYCNAADVCSAVLRGVDIFRTVYPNKVFDYMACAKPVIVAIDGVARKLVEDARAGVYVQPEHIRTTLPLSLEISPANSTGSLLLVAAVIMTASIPYPPASDSISLTASPSPLMTPQSAPRRRETSTFQGSISIPTT